jgi:hypothetical protein
LITISLEVLSCECAPKGIHAKFPFSLKQAASGGQLRCVGQFLLAHGKVLTHKFLLGELWDELTDAQYLRVYLRSFGKRSRPIPSGRNTF